MVRMLVAKGEVAWRKFFTYCNDLLLFFDSTLTFLFLLLFVYGEKKKGQKYILPTRHTQATDLLL